MVGEEEEVQLVEQEMRMCLERLPRFHNPVENETAGAQCPPHFDRTFCWLPIGPNSTRHRECPFAFCPGCHIPDRFVTRECLSNATWLKPDYTACIRIFKEQKWCIQSGCNTCNQPSRETVKQTVVSLCVLSIILPTIAFCVFISIKAIQCRRLTIHIHLVLSFIFRFVFFLAFVLAQNHVFYQCPALAREEQPQWDWLCKVLLWLLMYFQLASVFWMFVEGGFLVSRFTVFAMRNTDGPLLPYLLVGWGLPLIQMILWSALTETLGPPKFCWMPFTESDFIYILVGPMGFALVMNFLFLLTVIGILVQKLRAESTAESQRIWKTIKATILLVPLLGIANILLFYEPEGQVSEKWRHTYQLLSAILQHSQGASVAILYCFANAEVQRAMMRIVKQSDWFHRWDAKRSLGSRGKSEMTGAGNGSRVEAVEMAARPPPDSPPVLNRSRTPEREAADGDEQRPLNSARSIPLIDDSDVCL